MNIWQDATSKASRAVDCSSYGRTSAIGLIALMLISTAVGCNGSGPVEISGTVTFQGEPIEVGRIVFVSIDAEKAPTSSGTIKNGAYTITGRGGVQPGEYRVQISVFPPVQPGPPVAMDQIAPRKPIGPPLYAGEQSPLTADVTSAQKQYDFAVP